MASPKWILWLANSSDLSLIRPLRTARNKKLTVGLNKPGSLTFSMNITERAALDIAVITTCVLAYRNNIIVWSGLVWTIDDSIPDISVSCIGWFEELNHRILKCGSQAPASMPTTTALQHYYPATDATTATLDLLQRTNLDGNTHITVGRSDLSRVRNLTYQIYQNIGQAITDLSNIEGGFDFEVNPVTRALDIYYGTVKTGSTIFGRGVNRPEVVFGYRWGPSNLSNASRTTDGSKLMNQETATGRYGTGQQTDTASVATYGLYEEQQTLSEVVDVNVLVSFAAAEVAVRAQPMQIYNLTPMPSGAPRTPQPFTDYNLGDIVYFVAKYGRLQVGIPNKQSLRVFGFDVNVDDNGVEKVGQLQGVFSQ